MEEDLKWDAEIILMDVLDNVLKCLKARDLNHAAQVCNSWNRAAKLEFLRRGPERILIPNPYNPSLQDSEFYVANIFRAKPNVIILFCGPEPQCRSELGLEFEILKAYKNRFPSQTKLIVISVEQAMKDDLEIFGCPTNRANDLDIFNILGLALPNYRNLEIKVAYCVSHEQKAWSLAEEVVENLMPESLDQKSILLVFGRSYYSISIKVLEIIKNTYNNRMYTLWGGTTHNFMKIIDCKGDDFPSYLGMQGVICIRITGQSLEAHTIVVNCIQSIPEITQKLLEFKNRLILRRHTLGLVCGPCFIYESSSTLYECEVMINVIKKVFPDTSFTSYFSNNEYYFGLDSTNEDPDQKLIHKKCVSIMILTYD